MKCLNCGKIFYEKRGFLTLFETQKYYICKECKKEYPLCLKLEQVPLENHMMNIVHLFDNCYDFNQNAYCKETNYIFEFMYKHHPDNLLVLLDFYKLNMINLEVMSFLADCFNKDILLICGCLKK